MENNKSYKLVRHLGILAAPMGEVAKTVSIVRGGDLEPSLDIRKWENGEPKKGISLRGDEIRTLCHILKGEYPDYF